MAKKRDCFGEYNALDTFCVDECPDGPPCLKLKARVLLSCLPTDYFHVIAEMKVVGEAHENTTH